MNFEDEAVDYQQLEEEEEVEDGYDNYLEDATQ